MSSVGGMVVLMTKHFNELTEPEAERLAILSEECAEVIQIVSKILRHGYDSYNPNELAPLTNRELLEKEIAHVLYIASMLIPMDLNRTRIDRAIEDKAKSIPQWLHHNKIGDPA